MVGIKAGSGGGIGSAAPASTHARPTPTLLSRSGVAAARTVLVLVATAPDDSVAGRLRSLASSGYTIHCIALDQLPPLRTADPIGAILARTAGFYDLVYLQQAAVAARCLPAIRRHHPGASVLLDGEELLRHRTIRHAALRTRPDLLPHSDALAAEEAALARSVDGVLTASPHTAGQLRRILPAARIHTVPPALAAAPPGRPRSFARRRNLAFPGRFDRPADLEAARWLVGTVMPLVWREDPGIDCLLIGPAPDALHALGGPGVTVLDRLSAYAPMLGCIRLTVAPLHHGGPAAHILASLAAATPCVLTPAAAAGLDLPPPLRPLVAATAADFADAILALHTDPALHRATARAAAAWVHQAHAAAVVADAWRKAARRSTPPASAAAARTTEAAGASPRST